MSEPETPPTSGHVNLHQIGRTNLDTWARGAQERHAERHAGYPAGTKLHGWYEEAQDRIGAAEPGTRFTTALNALSETYHVDGTTFVTGDGEYTCTQAAGFLSEVGFPTDTIVDAIGSRLSSSGGISADAFAAVLGELTGEPDAARRPRSATAQDTPADDNTDTLTDVTDHRRDTDADADTA